jgi:SAM-dependent methyltransferase
LEEGIMHTAAWDFVRRVVQSLPPLKRVLEFGSRNVNGTVREIFTDANSALGVYHGLDLVPGKNVWIVADAADWRPPVSEEFPLIQWLYDAVVCCEVFEHAPRFGDICKSAFAALKPGGSFIITCATHPREPHSVDGDGPPKEGEYYHNVGKGMLSDVLQSAGFAVALNDHYAPQGDLYMLALKAR